MSFRVITGIVATRDDGVHAAHAGQLDLAATLVQYASITADCLRVDGFVARVRPG